MTDVHTQINTTSGSNESEGAAEEYLTFILAGEEYGLEILRVQEIKGWDEATVIPNTPEYILGVINLRGTIVPIIDLRKRFKLESIPFGPTTVVIVVKVREDGDERTIGIVVDAVSEVYKLENNVVQPPPDFGNAARTDFVRGLATVGEKMVILLEVDRLIQFGEIKDAIEADPVH